MANWTALSFDSSHLRAIGFAKIFRKAWTATVKIFKSRWAVSNNALSSNADGNAILLTCVVSAPLLLYPSLSLLVSGIFSLLSTKQILFLLLLPKLHSTSCAWLRPGFVQKTQLHLLRSQTTSHPLLSSFPEDGSPLIVFGDFNIHLNKPYAVSFLAS